MVTPLEDCEGFSPQKGGEYRQSVQMGEDLEPIPRCGFIRNNHNGKGFLEMAEVK